MIAYVQLTSKPRKMIALQLLYIKYWELNDPQDFVAQLMLYFIFVLVLSDTTIYIQ